MLRSDADLVASVLVHDDRRAFAELVRRHQASVRTFLRRLAGGDAATADDLAQEVFVKAWRGLASWRGDARFSTWLHGIAWNAWVSHARRAPSPEPPPPDPRPSASEEALRHHDLERALAQLGDDERAAIALAYAEDMTHEEAARILGRPVGTLKSLILRGKHKLRALLASADARTP
jgi:RNA polymerase sigma factor (sigma-70 family)